MNETKPSKLYETKPSKLYEAKPPANPAVGLLAGSDRLDGTSAGVHFTDDRSRITGDRTKDDRTLTTHHQHDHR